MLQNKIDNIIQQLQSEEYMEETEKEHLYRTLRKLLIIKKAKEYNQWEIEHA